MEAASIAHEHHGPPPAHRSSRVHAPTLGMLLFIMSEVMIFGAFFTAYFFIRIVTHNPWPAHGTTVPEAVAGVNTLILLSSSLTLHWALVSVRHGNRFGLKAGMVATFLLGLTFLFIQVNEYIHLGWAPHDSAQATVFYSLTGLHGAHVFIGLCALLIVNIRAFRGHYSPEHHEGMEVPGIYWHFVDIMWVIVYTTVYVLQLGGPLSEADAFRVLVRVVGALVVIVAIVLVVRALTQPGVLAILSLVALRPVAPFISWT